MPMARRDMLGRAFAQGPIRRALLAYTAASIAEYAAYFTVILMAFDAGGITYAGVAGAVQLAPSMVVPWLIGRFQHGTDHPMRLSLGWLAIMLAVSALVSAQAPFWLLVSVAAVRSIGYSLARPIHLAVLPVHAKRAPDLTAGMVVTGWVDAIGAMAGPAIAGLVLSSSSPSMVFAVCSVFAVGGLALSPRSGRIVRSDRGRPARSAFEVPGTGPLFVYKIGSAVLSGATDVMVVLVALELVGLGEDGAGYLSSLIGVGELVGSVFLVSLLGRTKLSGVLAASAAGRGLTLSVFGLAPQVFPLIALGGGFRPVDRVAQRLMLQRVTPPDRYMTTFGLQEAFDAGGQALGAALVPLVAAAFGLRATVVAAGALLPAMFLLLAKVFLGIDHRSSPPTGVLEALAESSALGGLPADAIEYLARAGDVESFESGERLVIQGDRSADCAWVVLEGSLEVSIDGSPVARVERSDLVGEMALLHGAPRNADVSALSHVSLLRLDRETFLDVVVGGRGGGEHVEILAASRADENRRLRRS